ncbi:MAG TPA: hypothetical protein DD414_01525, partial [Lachnospiraceae bacterium]|nr:hypothetical protein [Lachnospiraceae bacterium]
PESAGRKTNHKVIRAAARINTDRKILILPKGPGGASMIGRRSCRIEKHRSALEGSFRLWIGYARTL